MAEEYNLTQFAKKAGISISYASEILSDKPDKKRTPTVEMAIWIFSKTGYKLGILEGASDPEAKTLVRLAKRTGTVHKAA